MEEDGQVVEISLANERIYGDLRLTKVDKDYPDNKPVSYTHLDVYKRQGVGGWRETAR